MKCLSFLVLIFLCFLPPGCAQSGSAGHNNWIYDQEEILTRQQEECLDSLISAFEATTSNEIAIVTTPDIGDHEKMVHYAAEFGEKHRVGKEEKNNGLIIVLSKNLRQAFIATGYGTENILTDEICQTIIDSTMLPYFKKGNYYEGINAGVRDCIQVWHKNY